MVYNTGRVMEEVLELAVEMTGKYPIGKAIMLQVRDINTRSGISSIELNLSELASELNSYANKIAKHTIVRNHMQEGPLMYAIIYIGRDMKLIHDLQSEIANLEKKIVIKKEKLRIALCKEE